MSAGGGSAISDSGGDLFARDRALVDRCLAGESEAWGELFSEFHHTLCSLVRTSLRHSFADAELVDEIVARVWYKVISSEGRLLGAYRAEQRCRLSTYLLSIAKAEAKEYFRSESRRSNREKIANGATSGTTPAEEHPLTEELFASLTQVERRFLASVLLAPANEENRDYSSANVWQLRRRIARKIHSLYDPA